MNLNFSCSPFSIPQDIQYLLNIIYNLYKDLTIYINDLIIYIDNLIIYINDLTIYINNLIIYIDNLIIYINDLIIYINNLIIYINNLTIYYHNNIHICLFLLMTQNYIIHIKIYQNVFNLQKAIKTFLH